MVNTNEIPFRTFEGFRKQFALDGLSMLEKRLFDYLFPGFKGGPQQGKSAGTYDASDPYTWPVSAELIESLSPFIQQMPREVLPRRYAGYNLPRGCYFSLCWDAQGNDFQTLAHELRAYRNAVEAGMIEVLDLSHGPTLVIKDAQVPLEPQKAVAVLIHEPQRLPSELLTLNFLRLPALTSDELLVYRFPYTVNMCQVPRTIDLRWPDTQDWFYSTFRVPSETADSYLTPLLPRMTRTIGYSQFHLENGEPPVPTSFWEMLPTLVNPDLGGGNPADTGSTLMMIGNWMRQHNVNALIFPSARCDSAVVFEAGKMRHWQGWNLVDFAGGPPFPGAHTMTAVYSPWAWAGLPTGVRLEVAPVKSELSGSMAIVNMVNYWASDYKNQIHALKLARSLHGHEPSPDERVLASRALAARTFRMGILCLRWLREVLQRSPRAEIENGVLELQGLALPYHLYPLTGRIIELWNETQSKAISPAAMLNESLQVVQLVSGSLGSRYHDQEVDVIFGVGADIEYWLCLIAGTARTHHASGQLDQDVLKLEFAEREKSINNRWLNTELRARTGAFYEHLRSAFSMASTADKDCFEEGTTLEDAVYKSLQDPTP